MLHCAPEAICQMGRGMSDAQHLIQMANDIGNFFRANPVREDAVAGIANHIKSFWTRRMREKLLADLKLHGDGSLDELPLEAVRRLEASPEVKPEDSPGGDAGEEYGPPTLLARRAEASSPTPAPTRRP